MTLKLGKQPLDRKFFKVDQQQWDSQIPRFFGTGTENLETPP